MGLLALARRFGAAVLNESGEWKKASVERQAYGPDVIEKLRRAQPTLREQIAVQLLGMLALRKNELRLIRLSDFDLAKSTLLVHGKGNKVVVLPIGFDDIKRDLELYLVGRDQGEYLLYPKRRRDAAD